MKKSKFSFGRLFRNNRFCLIFSLIAAIVIWFSVSVAYSPTVTQVLNDVPVNVPLENTSFSNLKAFGNDTSMVQVTIQGKKYITGTADSSDVIVTANIGSIVGAGTYTLELTARKATGAGDFDVLAISPSTIVVRLDYEATETFDLSVEAPGISASSDDLTLTRHLSDSTKNQVSVTGPKSEVSKIARVTAYCATEETISKSTAFSASIRCYDAADNILELPYSTINYSDVDVLVSVEKHKSVPLTVNIINGPGELPDYQIFEISGENQTKVSEITVQGTPEVVDAMTSLSLGTVDFSQIKSTNNYTYEFLLPVTDEISFPEYNAITELRFEVRFSIKKLYTKTLEIPAASIRFKGLPAENSAVSQSAVKGLTVVSATPEIQKLTVANVVATVDCSGLSAGSYGSMKVTFSIKNYPHCWVIGDYSVTVRIS